MTNERIMDIAEQKAEKALEYCCSHTALILILFFILSLAIRFAFAPLKTVLTDDAYVYVLKAAQARLGDFSPMLTHFSGWPLFLSIFFRMSHDLTLTQQMVLARIISVVIGALLVLVLAVIARSMLDKKGLCILMVLCAFSPELISSSTSAMSEPIFTLTLLITIYFIIKSAERSSYLLFASLFAALGYYIRPNGIFTLLVVLIGFYVHTTTSRKKILIWSIFGMVTFFIISFPFLMQRYMYFGSIFNYGENSKYFADDYLQVWNYNIPMVSFFDYMRTHHIQDFLYKFIYKGLFKALYYMIFKTMVIILVPFFLYGIIMYFRKKNYRVLTVLLTVYILMLTPIIHVFGYERHLFPLIPVILIFVTASIMECGSGMRYKSIFVLIFLLIYCCASLQTAIGYKRYASTSYYAESLDWAQWIAKHIKGKIATTGGGVFVMMQLPDVKANQLGPGYLYSPQAGLGVITAGSFNDFGSALKWYREAGVTYLLIEEQKLDKKAFMKPIYYADTLPDNIKLIYTNQDSNSSWKIKLYKLE